jgi:hypothetical protein
MPAATAAMPAARMLSERRRTREERSRREESNRKCTQLGKDLHKVTRRSTRETN